MRKHKHHITYIVVIAILFGLTTINNSNISSNSNNVSALSYSSNVGVGFTFNPTLSVSISPSDLIISNLVPGSTLDSNVINVSVASNASYGYTLSAIMNGNNSSLTRTNNINNNIFSSIATNADLPSLDNSEDTNIWGYSYKDNTVETPAWSNYNGLSSSNSVTLLDTNTNNIETGIDSIDFKIAAKASNTQPSGEYTNTINFIAVSKVAPMSLLDSFIASGAEQLNGYYKMQDMTHDICEAVDIEESELQLIDVRDNKIYWVAKLKDGNCWMTQNLDLDLSHEVALTSETSDIDPESYGTTIYTPETGYTKDEKTGVVSWLPSTIDENGIQRADTIDMVWNGTTSATVPEWTNDNYKPYSANPGNKYMYTNNSTQEEKIYTSLRTCTDDNNEDYAGCQHTHFGNYFNWSAAIASNNTYNASGDQTNSVCPNGWRLPANGMYGTMLQAQNIFNYTNKYIHLTAKPLYFARFGHIRDKSLNYLNTYGYYWTNTISDITYSYLLAFDNNTIWPTDFHNRLRGFSLRCLAR